MPGDDYWIQRWTALVRKVLRWRAPTRRTLSRKRRDAATRAAISADVARFLGVMRAERALATEQRVFPHPRNWNRNKKKNKKKNKNKNKNKNNP